jgi:hypothetical protein
MPPVEWGAEKPERQIGAMACTAKAASPKTSATNSKLRRNKQVRLFAKNRPMF